MFLSIIVPCYNMGKYLNRCLKSITDNIVPDCEVVLVDDGSTDDTRRIYESWKYDDNGHDRSPWLTYVYQKNGGLSRARNTGMSVTSGEYVTFVDPDDQLFDDGLKSLIEAAKINDYPDWILGGNEYIDTEGNHEIHIPEEIKVVGGDTPRTVLADVVLTYWSSTWGKLYKREIIDRNGLQFVPGMIRGQDNEFNLRYLRHIKSLVTIPKVTYSYYFTPESISCNFKGKPHIDAQIKLKDTHVETINLLLEGTDREDALENQKRALRILSLTMLYIIYNNRSIKHRWKKFNELLDGIEAEDSLWLDEFHTGLSGRIRAMRRFGRLPIHVMMSFIGSIPALNRRLKSRY